MAREETLHIVIDIAPGGEAKIEVFGVQGQGCQALTKPFADLLGPDQTDELKPEYYAREEGEALTEGQRAFR